MAALMFSVQWLTDELFVPPVFLSSLVVDFMRNVGVALAERGPRHRGHAVDKLGLEQDVGVGKHAVFEGHHHKLKREGEKDCRRKNLPFCPQFKVFQNFSTSWHMTNIKFCIFYWGLVF